MWRRGGVTVMLAFIAASVVTPRAQVSETFTATATAKRGAVRASADVTISIHRYSTEQERAALVDALRAGGSAVRQALAAMNDAGYIQIGERRTSIKFAAQRPTGAGTLISVVTGDPLLFLGAGVPEARATAGYDIGVAMFEMNAGERGHGELAPAAKVGVDAQGALLIDDYGATVMWLNPVVRAR